MKKILLLFIVFSVTLAVQKKEIVLESVCSNENFRTERLTSFQSPTKGAYLLVHGAGNDNVNVQNTLLANIALIEANIQHNAESYPHKTHRVYRGKNTRLHLYNKMTNFIDTHLGKNNNQPALTEELKL